jgi:hypothetical protein
VRLDETLRGWQTKTRAAHAAAMMHAFVIPAAVVPIGMHRWVHAGTGAGHLGPKQKRRPAKDVSGILPARIYVFANGLRDPVQP